MDYREYKNYRSAGKRNHGRELKGTSWLMRT